mmetsp:Transcript_14024/g.41824  ORF Transcript_14024/g.41824 Transcript_14024/m.41824 type:complete len:229 (+) Transcript_14024:600-1286(+)
MRLARAPVQAMGMTFSIQCPASSFLEYFGGGGPGGVCSLARTPSISTPRPSTCLSSKVPTPSGSHIGSSKNRGCSGGYVNLPTNTSPLRTFAMAFQTGAPSVRAISTEPGGSCSSTASMGPSNSVSSGSRGDTTRSAASTRRPPVTPQRPLRSGRLKPSPAASTKVPFSCSERKAEPSASLNPGGGVSRKGGIGPVYCHAPASAATWSLVLSGSGNGMCTMLMVLRRP